MDIRKLSAVLNHTTLSLSSASFCKYKAYVLFSSLLLCFLQFWSVVLLTDCVLVFMRFC